MHAMHDAGKGIFVKKSLDTPTNQQHLKLFSLKKFGRAKKTNFTQQRRRQNYKILSFSVKPTCSTYRHISFSIPSPLCVTTYTFLFPTLKIIILWDKNAFKNNTQHSFINVILSIVLLLELRFENRNIYLVGIAFF